MGNIRRCPCQGMNPCYNRGMRRIELYTAEELALLRRKNQRNALLLAGFCLAVLLGCVLLAATAGTLNAPQREGETILLSSAGGIAAIAFYTFAVSEGRRAEEHTRHMLEGARTRCRGQISLTGERVAVPGSIRLYRLLLEEEGGKKRRVNLYEKKRKALPEETGPMTMELVGSYLAALEVEE